MATEEPGQGPNSAEDARLSALDERLTIARRAEEIRTGKSAAPPSKGYSQGNRVLAELIAGPAGGGLVGWLLDRWLGTSPWLLLAFLAIGIGVAFRNIIRISGERPE